MDVVVKLDAPELRGDIMKLQAAIKHGQGDVAAARTMVEECPPDDVDTIVNTVRQPQRLSVHEPIAADAVLSVQRRAVRPRSPSVRLFLKKNPNPTHRPASWWPKAGLKKRAPNFRRP